MKDSAWFVRRRMRRDPKYAARIRARRRRQEKAYKEAHPDRWLAYHRAAVIRWRAKVKAHPLAYAAEKIKAMARWRRYSRWNRAVINSKCRDYARRPEVKAKRKEYDRQYREKNKEKIRLRYKRWYDMRRQAKDESKREAVAEAMRMKEMVDNAMEQAEQRKRLALLDETHRMALSNAY